MNEEQGDLFPYKPETDIYPPNENMGKNPDGTRKHPHSPKKPTQELKTKIPPPTHNRKNENFWGDPGNQGDKSHI